MTNKSAVKVAIIGAGIGGLYLVAELGIAGFKLRLHCKPDLPLASFAEGKQTATRKQPHDGPDDLTSTRTR